MARKTRRVFILGGGAALGAHHVGALKYLDEQGIKPDVIVASSIGVINACVYASGGIPALEEAWRTLRSLPLIVSPSLRDNPLFGLSLFSAGRLQRAIEEHVDFPKVFESRLELEFILLNLSRGAGEMMGQKDCADWRDLRTIMRAGYAIPFLFPPVRCRGEWYVDGGFAWNVPLDYALGLQPTEVYILAPITSELPYKRTFTSFVDFTSRVADVLWRTIGNMGYIYAPISEGKVGETPVTVIEPGEQWSGANPFMIFNAYPRKSQNLMEAGYRDAKRALAVRRRARERSAGTREEAQAARAAGGARGAGAATTAEVAVGERSPAPATAHAQRPAAREPEPTAASGTPSRPALEPVPRPAARKVVSIGPRER
ncbi:MAG TPA: patatin-like phospholipase family protein [Candidatus Binatia bacterium]|nr:patatin-like phospholipase family protein [Candidatus Binatia bacterium]